MRTACVCLLLAPVTVAGWSPPVRAEANPLVRLRGTARIEAHAGTNGAGEMVLRGRLTDDVGEPLRSSPLSVGIVDEGGTTNAIDAHPRPCGPHFDLGPFASDERGAFCGRLQLPLGRYVARLVFAGNGLVYGASVDLPVDLGRRAVIVQWEDPPTKIDLGSSQVAVTVTARTDDGDAEPGRHHDEGASGIPIAIADERGALLARGSTDATGRARMTIDTTQVGAPGPGRWDATFEGSTERAPASSSVSVVKHLAVAMSAPAAVNDLLPAGVPEEGLNVRFVVSSARGSIDGGSVEAHAAGVLVGAAPVRAGVAEVAVSFVAEGLARGGGGHRDDGGFVPLTFRYLASAPWYDPPDAQTLYQPIRAPSRWREVPLVAAGVLALAWFVWVRAKGRPRARAPLAAAPLRPETPLEATLTQLTGAEGTPAGWAGTVVDARTGAPLRGASVAIQRGAFDGVTRLAHASTDSHGAFQLPAVARQPGGAELLVIEASLHVALRRPLPPMGTVGAALVSRRDALLARLVGWARRRGPPFDARPEPTPNEVRLAAVDDASLAAWALAVENAAYAGMPVDGGREAAVDALAPVVALPRERPPRAPPPGSGDHDAPPEPFEEPTTAVAQAKEN